ncbi:hypothetical protein [Chroococcidiopsis sp.]|uniref:hypothetical protein n=1 Tax=Chroococcidiopsis sp. TaxID=3088168 RepID=UPI003F40A70A
MNIVNALANSIKASESQAELKEFLDDFLSIETDQGERTLVISQGQTQIKINESKLELRIGEYGNFAKIVLNNAGEVHIEDGFNNKIDLQQLSRKLAEIPLAIDDREDENSPPTPPPTPYDPSNVAITGGSISGVSLNVPGSIFVDNVRVVSTRRTGWNQTNASGNGWEFYTSSSDLRRSPPSTFNHASNVSTFNSAQYNLLAQAVNDQTRILFALVAELKHHGLIS